MFKYDPLHYHILLTPDLDAFRFSGKSRVRLSPHGPLSEVRFHARDLTLRRVVWIRGREERPCPFQVDPESETLTVFLPEGVSEEIELAFDFDGYINDQMAGLYRSRFRTGNETRWIAVTQFQESDARRVFPCLDHPAKKAVFTSS